jgi:hypothetical protein
LNWTITQFGGTRALNEVYWNDIPAGGVGIKGAAWTFSGHDGSVYSVYTAQILEVVFLQHVFWMSEEPVIFSKQVFKLVKTFFVALAHFLAVTHSEESPFWIPIVHLLLFLFFRLNNRETLCVRKSIFSLSIQSIAHTAHKSKTWSKILERVASLETVYC